MLTFEQYNGLADHFTRFLFSDGEKAADWIEATYGESARQTALLLSRLSDPEPPQPAVEPEDDTRPACAWCGRNDPEDGLEDFSEGEPAAWSCNDLAACLETHDAKLAVRYGLDAPGGQVIERTGPAAGAGPDEADAGLNALASWRAMRERRAAAESQDEAPNATHAPARGEDSMTPPVPAPAPVTFDNWGHTLRSADSRTHLVSSDASGTPPRKKPPGQEQAAASCLGIAVPAKVISGEQFRKCRLAEQRGSAGQSRCLPVDDGLVTTRSPCTGSTFHPEAAGNYLGRPYLPPLLNSKE
jgi:hypothetical protein